MTKPLHVINYEGKEYRIPFDLDLGIDNGKVIDVPNRFSGEKASLPWFAVAVYDAIKGAELTDDYRTVRKGLDWFQKNFTEEYYILLD